MSEVKIQFRNATLQDSDLLFRWRNDELTRNNSLRSDPISREDHEKWLKTSLESQNRKLLVAESGGTLVGTVRLDRIKNEWELSWTVAPEARGKGIGASMVKAATGLVPENLLANIKTSNQASLSIADKAGFTFSHENGDLKVFRLKK